MGFVNRDPSLKANTVLWRNRLFGLIIAPYGPGCTQQLSIYMIYGRFYKMKNETEKRHCCKTTQRITISFSFAGSAASTQHLDTMKRTCQQIVVYLHIQSMSFAHWEECLAVNCCTVITSKSMTWSECWCWSAGFITAALLQQKSDGNTVRFKL